VQADLEGERGGKTRAPCREIKKRGRLAAGSRQAATDNRHTGTSNHQTTPTTPTTPPARPRPQEYRAAIIRNFCTKVDSRSGKQLPRHPVEPLSLAEVGETLHKPFDVAQTRFSLAGGRQ
jgi:hypothetical protein